MQEENWELTNILEEPLSNRSVWYRWRSFSCGLIAHPRCLQNAVWESTLIEMAVSSHSRGSWVFLSRGRFILPHLSTTICLCWAVPEHLCCLWRVIVEEQNTSGMIALGCYEVALACFEVNFQSCVPGSGWNEGFYLSGDWSPWLSDEVCCSLAWDLGPRMI